MKPTTQEKDMSKGRMRFHSIGIPHTITNADYCGCAFSMKCRKFCKMMCGDHEVIHYGVEGSDVESYAPGTKHVDVVSRKLYDKVYGGHDYRSKFFKYDVNDEVYRTFYRNTIAEIARNKQKNDFILAWWGSGVRPVCDAHPDLLTVESGIGYPAGHWAKYKVFESYAMLHAYYGLPAVANCKQNFYDVVIPNFFDIDDFEYRDHKDKGDYFLFLGRVYEGKGVHIAVQVAEKLGIKLIVAGQNSLASCGYKKVPQNVTEIGYADVEKKKELMAGAIASFLPSMYVEPFCGVQVENLLSGTPLITTDWGAMAEVNEHGVTGMRCRTFRDFCEAAVHAQHGRFPSSMCRRKGLEYSLPVIKIKYEKYFRDVLDIYTGKGWYECQCVSDVR